MSKINIFEDMFILQKKKKKKEKSQINGDVWIIFFYFDEH